MSTLERLQKVIAETIFEGFASENASFIDDLGADSLDLAEIVMAAEEEFEIEISDDDAEGILTVGDAVKYIDRALAA